MTIIKFITVEEDWEDYYTTNEEELTEEQSMQLYSLNSEYIISFSLYPHTIIPSSTESA